MASRRSPSYLLLVLLTVLSMTVSLVAPTLTAPPVAADEVTLQSDSGDDNAGGTGTATDPGGDTSQSSEQNSSSESPDESTGKPGTGQDGLSEDDCPTGSDNENCLGDGPMGPDEETVADGTTEGTSGETGAGQQGSSHCSPDRKKGCDPGDDASGETGSDQQGSGHCSPDQKKGCAPPEEPENSDPCRPAGAGDEKGKGPAAEKGSEQDEKRSEEDKGSDSSDQCPPETVEEPESGETQETEQSGESGQNAKDLGGGDFQPLSRQAGEPCDFENKNPNDVECIRITVWKIWAQDPRPERPTGATITLTINGQDYTVTCTHNQGQAICGLVDVVLQENTTIEVSETIVGNPSYPFEWTTDAGPGTYTFLGSGVPIGTDPIDGNQPIPQWAGGNGEVWDCLNPEQFCGVKIYNRPLRKLLYLQKRWHPAPDPIPTVDLQLELYDRNGTQVGPTTTHTCPNSNPALCAGPIVVDDSVTEIDVQEVNPPNGYSVSGTGRLAWCGYWTCSTTVTNYRSTPVIRIFVTKEWRNRWGLNPLDPGANVTITVDGEQVGSLTCPMGGQQGPFMWSTVSCGYIELPIDAIATGQQVTVSEAVPNGWTIVQPSGGSLSWTWNSADPSAMNQRDNGLTCSGSLDTGISCQLNLVNRQEVERAYTLRLRIYKMWASYDYWPLQAATIEAVVHGQTQSIVCPRAWPGTGYNLNDWIECGEMVFTNVTFSDTLESFVERPLPDWGYTHWGDTVITGCRWVTVPTEIRCDRYVRNTPFVNVLRVYKRWLDPDSTGLPPVPATIRVTLPNGAQLQMVCTPPQPYDTANGPWQLCGSRRINVSLNDLVDVQETITGNWGPVSGVGLLQAGGNDPAFHCQQVQERIECDLRVTNRAPLKYRIDVRKWWLDADGASTSGPGTNIQLLVDNQTITVNCAPGQSPVACDTLEFDSMPTLQTVEEPSVPSGWLVRSGVGSLNQACNPYCAVDVVNVEEYRVQIEKEWYVGDGSALAPAESVPGTILVVTVNGQTRTVNCPANQPRGRCEELVLPGRPWQLTVSEPNPPAGWSVWTGTGDWAQTCRVSSSPCKIVVSNRYSRPHIAVTKQWLSYDGSWIVAPFAVDLTVGVDNMQHTMTCPEGSWIVLCGVIPLTGDPSSIAVAEPSLKSPWYLQGWELTGDCWTGCTLTVTNRRGATITVEKQWVRLNGPAVDHSEITWQQQLDLTIALADGTQVQQQLTCEEGSNPSRCGSFEVLGNVQSVQVNEPSLPEYWIFWDVLWRCRPDGECTVTVVNRDTRYYIYVYKGWYREGWQYVDAGDVPGTTIVVTVDGNEYPIVCPPGQPWGLCGRIPLPSRPTSSIGVSEPNLGEEWVSLLPSEQVLNWCLQPGAESCTLRVTNLRNSEYTIQVWKHWYDNDGNLVPGQVPSTLIRVWIDGREYVFSCESGATNPVDCGSITLRGKPRQVTVEEPSLPPGWTLIRDGKGEQWTCNLAASSCELVVRNKLTASGPPSSSNGLVIRKVWLDEQGNLTNGPRTWIRVTVDGIPILLECGDPDHGVAVCGSIEFASPPSSIRVDEPMLPAGWSYVSGAGDYSDCAQRGCTIELRNKKDGKGEEKPREVKSYEVVITKEWRDETGHGNHPATDLAVVIESNNGRVSLRVHCEAGSETEQICARFALEMQPYNVTVAEPEVPEGWAAEPASVTVQCPEAGPCEVRLSNVRREQPKPTETYRVSVMKHWLDETGSDAQWHPATRLVIVLEGMGGSTTLEVPCEEGESPLQECYRAELEQPPLRVTVSEPVVPEGWVAQPSRIEVECTASHSCEARIINARLAQGGGSGTGGGNDVEVTGGGESDGGPTGGDPTSGGPSGGSSNGGSSGGAQQSIEPSESRAQANDVTYQGEEGSLEDERVSESRREGRDTTSLDTAVQLLPRTGRPSDGTGAERLGLVVVGVLLLFVASFLASRSTRRVSITTTALRAQEQTSWLEYPLADRQRSSRTGVRTWAAGWVSSARSVR